MPLETISSRIPRQFRRIFTSSAPTERGGTAAAGRRLFVEGREVTLTPREYDLFVYLIRHRGKVVEPAQIAADVWGSSSRVVAVARSVDATVQALSQKLGGQVTVVGDSGYRLG